MYLTLLRPIVLYGTETWPLRKTEERRITVFERKVLRKMYGAYFDVLANEWRKLHNEELQSLFQRPDILKEIKKKRRLVWAGHAWRKHDSLIRRETDKSISTKTIDSAIKDSSVNSTSLSNKSYCSPDLSKNEHKTSIIENNKHSNSSSNTDTKQQSLDKQEFK
ncbi:Hypothetical protein CINCED_3A010486, partial [Cinara cedri]